MGGRSSRLVLVWGWRCSGSRERQGGRCTLQFYSHSSQHRLPTPCLPAPPPPHTPLRAQTNVSVCSSLGHPFLSQFNLVFLDMLQVYK